MLFMIIFNYEPQNRDEIVKRRMEKGSLIPEGVKTIGEWTGNLRNHSVRYQNN